MTDTMLSAALALAGRGWQVFPCKAKFPLTKHGHRDATTDAEQIRQWWGRWPCAQIGGPVPVRLLVLDVDKPNAMAELEALVGPLPETLTTLTGRGRHLWFYRPAGPLTGIRLPKGIDLRSGGSHYVLLPPSIHHKTHTAYEWANKDCGFRALPTALRDLLRTNPRPVTRPAFKAAGNGSGLIRTVAEATEGDRHDALVWASFRARDDDLLDTIEQQLIDASVATGYPEKDAQRVIDSVRRSEL
jgi:hypothetical protein